MTTLLFTPPCSGEPVQLASGLWRKQILPKGTIKYTAKDGSKRDITFDDAYLNDLASSFRDQAFDAVPFQLADHANRHTNDPERTRGAVKDVEVADDGLYGIFDLGPAGAELVRGNPKLGVSVKIAEQMQRADGKAYPRALAHVLGTLDPQIPGMKAWEEVALSTPETGDTVDLTASTYEPDGAPVPNPPDPGTGTPPADETTTLTLSVEDAQRLTALLANPEPGENLEFAARAEIELANARIVEMERQLAAAETDREVERLSATGLAPAIIEAARPLLAARPGDLELANGDERIDVGATVRAVLDTVLDLAKKDLAVVELGRETGMLLSVEDDGVVEKRTQALAEFSKTYGA